MSRTPLPRLPMTRKIREVLAATTEKPVGKGAVPRGADRALVDPPYLILYPLWATTSGPPFGNANADAEWIYQVSAYATDSDQLEWIRDRVLKTFLEQGDDGAYVHPFPVDGLSEMLRELREDSGTVTGTDSSSGIMSSDLRFAVKVTPT